MGTFRCVRCTGHGEYKDKAEAIQLLDHSLGISKGRPCRGGDTAPIEEISPKITIAEKPKAEEKPKKPKSSEK